MDASPTAAASAAGVTPGSSASQGSGHVLQAQQALQRGLDALAALGAGASDSDAAAALLDAALHIRTVAEEQAAEEASAAGDAPFAFAAPDPATPFRQWVSTHPARTSTVLRLFDRLETDERELELFRAQARRSRATLAQLCAVPFCSGLTRLTPQASASAAELAQLDSLGRASVLTGGDSVTRAEARALVEARDSADNAVDVAAADSWGASAHALAEVEAVARLARERATAAARSAELARATLAAATDAARAHAVEEDAAAQAVAAAVHAAARAASSAAAAAISPQGRPALLVAPTSPFAASTPPVRNAEMAELTLQAHAARAEAAELRAELARERQSRCQAGPTTPAPASQDAPLLDPAAAVAGARADAAVSAERARVAALEAALAAARQREEKLYAALQLAYEEAESLSAALQSERARAADLGSALASAGERPPRAGAPSTPPAGARPGERGASAGGAASSQERSGSARPTLRGAVAAVTAASRAAAAVGASAGAARASSPRKPAVPRFGGSRPPSRGDA